MSQILHRREINVAITAEEAGREFAHAAMDVQAEFLLAWMKAAAGFNWCLQCCYIKDELYVEEKQKVVKMLETLLEHLKEPDRE